MNPIDERFKGLHGEPNRYGDSPDSYVIVNRNAVKWLLTRAKFPTDMFSGSDEHCVAQLTASLEREDCRVKDDSLV